MRSKALQRRQFSWVSSTLPFCLAIALWACDGLGQYQDELDSADAQSADTEDTSQVPLLESCVGVELDLAQLLEDASLISFDGESISVQGSGAVVSGQRVTIQKPGAYRLSGQLEDGQLLVDSSDDGDVLLVLDGVELESSNDAPLQVLDADRCIIFLAEGSSNRLLDAQHRDEASEANAALYAKTELIILGDGALELEGRYQDGITGKDELHILGGHFRITAIDDGIRGKDFLSISGGVFELEAGGDALKSDNEEDSSLGYVCISAGDFELSSAADGIQAQTQLLISGGSFVINAGGGSQSSIAADASAKGLKAGSVLHVADGVFQIDSADDAVHADESILIDGGVFTILSGDDAVHAEKSLTIGGGDFDIQRSYEGLESEDLAIEAGTLRIVASDDGINAAGGVDGSGGLPGPGRPGGPGEPQPSGGDYSLTISGGHIVVDAAGDGLDVNGSIVMTGGTVLVHGPTAEDNGAIDYDQSFTISGGLLLAVGSARMAQAPSSNSSQNSLLFNAASTQAASTLVHLRSVDGQELFSFAPSKPYQSVLFSSPALVFGDYELYLGGASTGTVENGLYIAGSYSPGSLAQLISISTCVTKVNVIDGPP